MTNPYEVKYCRSNCLSREALIPPGPEKKVMRLSIVDTRPYFPNIYPEMDTS